MLPNFFVVGAQKAATTSLHNYLNAHPEIYLPAQKETHFFVVDEFYNKGIEYYERQYFGDWAGQKAVGEVDPDYMYFENVLPRVADHIDLSGVKFIFLLRNPVERAFSHYVMSYRRGLEPLTFEEAIIHEAGRIGKDFLSREHLSYVSRGFYHQQIRRFYDYVDKDQILVLLTEDLRRDPKSELRTVFQFLGVDSDFTPANLNQEFHKATVPRNMALLRRIIGGDTIEKNIIRLLIPSKRLREKLRTKLIELNQTNKHDFALTEKTRKKLVEIFREENDRLAKFIGRDLNFWNK